MTGSDANRQLGPGRLVLVVGPSGAGKDTLIRAARDRLSADPRFVFPRRVVTREASPNEDNHPCDVAEFARIAASGGFAITWSAHGLSYGIPATMRTAVREGRTVVINVSRRVVAELRGGHADVLVIEVTAPPAILAERLSARARPDDGDLTLRLERSAAILDLRPDLTIVNEGSLDDAVADFMSALRALRSDAGMRSGTKAAS